MCPAMLFCLVGHVRAVRAREGQLNRTEAVVIAGAVGGAAAEGVRSVFDFAQLGDMEVTRIGMHPGSVQGFGQLGPERVPVFLLPANPVSALVVFEMMVRPRRTAPGSTIGVFTGYR